MAAWNAYQVESDLGKDVDIISFAEVEEVTERGDVYVAVLQLGPEVTPSGLIDPQLQEIRETCWRDTTNDLFRLLPIVIERDLAAVRETHVPLFARNDDRDPVAYGLLRWLA